MPPTLTLIGREVLLGRAKVRFLGAREAHCELCFSTAQIQRASYSFEESPSKIACRRE
jgi:hypothetical protein